MYFLTATGKIVFYTGSAPQLAADAFTLSSMSRFSAKFRNQHVRASMRWMAVLAISVLLHVIFISGMVGNITLPSFRDQTPMAITAQLHRAPPPAPAPATPKPKALLPKKREATPKRPPPPTAPAEAIAAPSRNAAWTPSAEEPAKLDLAEMSEALLALEGAAPADEVPPSIAQSAPEPEPAATDQSPQYKFGIPPSAELKYDVQALRDGQMVYGSGKIRWESDGGNYTVDGEASILFFTLLSFKSAGVIDDSGVAPVIYTEKRFRRAETNTHFHRERNTISFSASTASYPRKGGEQDRASIIWQLTGIGRGDREKFKPSAEIEFFVAGVRDAEAWRIRVIGEEEIEIGSGKVAAWHVVRIPKPGSYDQQLDIWLAPQHEWYPVKLRFTEKNGEYLDMLLSNMKTIAAN
jgi:hypothetical protein